MDRRRVLNGLLSLAAGVFAIGRAEARHEPIRHPNDMLEVRCPGCGAATGCMFHRSIKFRTGGKIEGTCDQCRGGWRVADPSGIACRVEPRAGVLMQNLDFPSFDGAPYAVRVRST